MPQRFPPRLVQGEGNVTVYLADASEMAGYRSEWEAVAAEALEPNPFYEPWMALPALEFLTPGGVKFLLVFVRDPGRPGERAILSGVFPLEMSSTCRGVPAPALRLWHHEHCFLCTPLVRAGEGRRCLSAFLDWVVQDGWGRRLLELGTIPAEGAFYRTLVDELHQRQMLSYAADLYTRPMLRPWPDPDAYTREVLTAHRRSELRRCQRHLAGNGRKLEYQVAAAGEEPDGWIEEFLRLEAGGWKGREGGAMACHPGNAAFFRAMAREGLAQGRLLMQALRLDGRPIALNVVLVSGRGSFFFKTAFDEATGHSPGIMLQAHAIQDFHERAELAWMDSCTAPGNHVLNELWPEQRAIQNLFVSTGRAAGDLLVASMPLMRWARRSVRRTAPHRRL